MNNPKKTSRLFVFCASLLIGVGVLVGLPALALFEENFDNLELGGIANQGGWDNDSTAAVVDDQSNSPDQSLYLSSAGRYAIRTLSPAVSEGEINFYFRGDIDYYRNNPMRLVFYADGVFQFGVDFIDNSSGGFNIRAYNKPTEVARVVNAREWYPVKIEFTATHYRISSGEDFGNWLDRDNITGDIDKIRFEAPASYRPVMWIDDIGGGIPPHEVAITYPENEASLGNQLHHFTVEYFTPDCGDFHLQIAIGTNEQDVENATSSSPGIQYVDTLFGLREWCAAEGEIDVGNYVILDENKNYYAKPILYRWEGWNKKYDTKLAEGAVIGFAVGEYFGMATENAAADFYADHLPAFFGETEPSAIYSTLTKVFNAVFNPILDFLSDITIYFSTATAIENGTAAGYPIAVFLAYAALVNDFAGIPLVEIITTMLILQLAIVVINLALKGKKTAI